MEGENSSAEWITKLCVKLGLKKPQNPGIKKHGSDQLCNFTLIEFQLQLINSLNTSADFWLCAFPQPLRSESEETLADSSHSLYFWQHWREYVNTAGLFRSLRDHQHTELCSYCAIAQTRRVSSGAESRDEKGQHSHPCVNVNRG